MGCTVCSPACVWPPGGGLGAGGVRCAAGGGAPLGDALPLLEPAARHPARAQAEEVQGQPPLPHPHDTSTGLTLTLVAAAGDVVLWLQSDMALINRVLDELISKAMNSQCETDLVRPGSTARAIPHAARTRCRSGPERGNLAVEEAEHSHGVARAAAAEAVRV